MIEIETKFKIESPTPVRKRLKRMGARLLTRGPERDEYFKPPVHCRHFKAVRLRSDVEGSLFTVKLHCHAKQYRAMKSYEEIETRVGNPAAFRQFLAGAGFAALRTKEKIRETYLWRGAKVCLDRLPYMGYFVEIEGEPARIREGARKLGFDMASGIADDYLSLFEAHRKKFRLKSKELVFKS